MNELAEEHSLTPPGPNIPLGRLLHDAARLRRYAFDVLSAPSGLTRAQYSVLAFLQRSRDPEPTQTELANALRLGKVTLGVTLERLEDKNFVRRKLAPYDRRLKIVFLTQKGRDALERVSRVPSEIDELMMQGLDPEAQRQLMHAIAVIRENLLTLEKERKSLEREQPETVGRKKAA